MGRHRCEASIIQPVEIKMDKSIFIRADELAAELDVSKALAYKMINQWNEELKAKGYTTVGGRVSRQYYYEKIYGAEKEKADACV